MIFFFYGTQDDFFFTMDFLVAMAIHFLMYFLSVFLAVMTESGSAGLLPL